MKKNQWIVYLVGGLLVLALALWVRGHVHFEWSVFLDQMRHVSWGRIVAGIALIWGGYVLRAVRWAVLIRRQKRTGWVGLLGSQVIGFTAVALFGRLADLVRPYLVARRVQLALTSQIAVYTLERMFDLAAMALIFSSALLLAPDRATLPHHDALRSSAVGALVVTLALGVFAVVVRVSGRAVAGFTERAVGTLSPSLGRSVSQKIRAFRDGLDAIQSWREFLYAMAVSLVMWGMITMAYLETVHAFVLSPELSSMTLARCLVLMAASMVGSIVQLPVIGWFTQIGVTVAVLQSIFHVRFEPALGCGALLLIVTFMCIIPVGLVWARFEHVSLKKVSQESEHLAVGQVAETVVPSAG